MPHNPHRLSRAYPSALIFVLPGPLPSKKNRYKIGNRGLYIDRDLGDWIDDSALYITSVKNKARFPTISAPCIVLMDIVVANMRKDMDNIETTVLDVMQRAGVYENDKLVVFKAATKRQGTNDHVKVVVQPLANISKTVHNFIATFESLVV